MDKITTTYIVECGAYRVSYFGLEAARSHAKYWKSRYPTLPVYIMKKITIKTFWGIGTGLDTIEEY